MSFRVQYDPRENLTPPTIEGLSSSCPIFLGLVGVVGLLAKRPANVLSKIHSETFHTLT